MLTAATLFELAATAGLSVIDTRVLIAHGTLKSREWLIAHRDDELSSKQYESAGTLIKRRAAGEPVAYLVGEKEFYAHRFQVNPSVLIPRPDTEMLVDHALTLMGERQTCRVIDFGTGSGCIGIALALEKPRWEVLLTDVSEAALLVARRNAQALGASNVRQALGSWWQAVQPHEAGFDLIISNPPYIQSEDPHLALGDLRFEPQGALTDFSNGLSAYEAILAGISVQPHRLNSMGSVIFEHGYHQAQALKNLLTTQYAFAAKSYKDLAGHPRMMVAHRVQSGKII